MVVPSEQLLICEIGLLNFTGKKRTMRLTHIDRYQIIKVLGRGGMGTVFLCRDTDLQRHVAVKMFDVKKGRMDINLLRQRFLREVLTTSILQHPCIPPVYDFKQHASGRLYYVMKPINGSSLQDILINLRRNNEKINGFDQSRLVEILREVCRAVHYAHIKGFIHRDLKPANIFVGNYGEVYVIDWGLTKIIGNPQKNLKNKDAAKDNQRLESVATELAQTLESLGDEPTTVFPEMFDEQIELTVPGNIMGTLPYMPPEQASGNHAAVGKESDIYAMGVILYEMLTLQLPFYATSIKEMIRQKNSREIILPEIKTPTREIPPELSMIAMQAMNPMPEERFKSAKDLQQALESWLEGKTQFRPAARHNPGHGYYQAFPKGSQKNWDITPDTVTTLASVHVNPEPFLLFVREFIGDIRFSVDFIAYPKNDATDRISEVALIINAGDTIRNGIHDMDGYLIRLGAAKNMRAILSKNGVDMVSNEYMALEPRRRYKLTFERFENDIKIILNRHPILVYHDNDPLTGVRAGFVNRGAGVVFSDIRVHVRGFPMRVPAMDVPEALMREHCYDAAAKRFLAISLSHRNRQEGAWARYRAGIAIHRINGDRSAAAKIWAPLKKGSYAVFEKLGHATLDIEDGKSLKTAAVIKALLSTTEPTPHIDCFADIVFSQAQQLLRNQSGAKHGWREIDAWARLALVIGQKVEGKRSLTPTILWQWILLALTKYPKHLSECTLFLNETFGKGKGAFAETLTSIEPLMTILKRSVKMSGHAFLVDKVMKLILNHDDNLGNLETLVRFYLHSGHVDVAKTISRHINSFCIEHGYSIPPAPIAFTAWLAWLEHDARSGELIRMMINNSYDWAPADGWLLLGIDCVKAGQPAKAREYWKLVASDSTAVSFNRHLFAKGLLGELAADPVRAGVPNRSDHRLLYYLFMGLRSYAEWLNTRDEQVKQVAIDSLNSAHKLTRPSYDIYATTDIFVKIPLKKMRVEVPARMSVEPLSDGEIKWLQRLTDAAGKEMPAHIRLPSEIRNRFSGGTRPLEPV